MPQKPMKEPTKAESLARIAKVMPSITFLGSSLALLNTAQTASLLVKPFAPDTFRKFNRWVANTWWGWCVDLSIINHGTNIILSGDDIPPKENAIVVSNHQQMADITFLFFLAREKGRLGDLKWFAKDPIKYVPFMGWAMVLLDSVFVKRDWSKDKDSINATFSKFIRDDVPMWLITFPEGTRVNPEKIEKSTQYAKKVGRRALKHLLLPRTKGFAASVIGLRAHIDAVYDITIGYEHGVPTLWQFIKGTSTAAHINVKRFPVSGLPEDQDGLSEWLFERFEKKDQLLDEFYEKGCFPSQGH